MSPGFALLLFLTIVGAHAYELPRRSFIVSYGDSTSGRLGQNGLSKNVVDLKCPRSICAIRSISVASDYAIVNTGFGTFGWGSNSSGELGNGKEQNHDWEPTELYFPTFGSNRPSTLIALENSTTYISSDNKVEAYGDSSERQFGLLHSTVVAANTTRREYAALEIHPKGETLSCAGTRCYFKDEISNIWGYWGNAIYDPDYNPMDPHASVIWITNSYYNWIESSASTVYFGTFTSILAKGYNLLDDPTENAIYQRFDSPCVPSIFRRLAAAGGGFFVYSCNNAKMLFSFGKNDFHQLGNSSTNQLYIPATNEHVLVEIDLGANETIFTVVAGKSTAYAFTTDGNVWVWGYFGNNAAGEAPNLGGGYLYFLKPNSTHMANQINSVFFKYQVTDIKATPAADGIFLVLAMRFGNCNQLPSELNIPDIFCDYDDFLNFPIELEMNGAMKGEMKSFMKMRGDMSMRGNSKMLSKAGMVMEGALSMFDATEALLTGYGELIGDIKMFDASKLHFSNSNTSLTGNLEVGPLAQIILTDLNATFFDVPALTFNGTANISGSITITYSQAEIDAMVSSFITPTTSSPDTTPDSMGPSSGPLSTMLSGTKMSTIIQTTDGSLDTTKSTVSVQLLQPTSSCSSITGVPSVEGNNLNVLFTITTDTSCTPSNALTPDQAAKNAAKNKTTGIIIGCVIGGVLLLALLAAVLILKVKPIRNAVLPYREASRRRAEATRLQVEAHGNEA